MYNTVYEELKEAGKTIGNEKKKAIKSHSSHYFIVMAEGFDRYKEGGEAAHEAGYDAYMTGVIYLAFVAFIREKEGIPVQCKNISYF